MMRLRHSQQGMTAIGWICMLILAGIVALAGIRLFPVYMESQTINSIMRSVASDVESSEPAQVRRALSRQMQVNSVREVSQNDFSIETIDGTRTLVVSYDHRVPFMGNVDFIVSFEKKQEFREQ